VSPTVTKPLTHAGTVVFREADGELLYLVVSSSDGANWVLPKGHIEPAETPQLASLRELEEEAGILGEIVAPLSERKFKTSDKKGVIQYFLVRAVGSTGSMEGRTVRWEREKEALGLLTFPEAGAALLEGAAIVRQMRGKI